MAAVAPALSTLHANINYFLEINEGGTDIVYPGTAIDKLRPFNGASMPITDIRECDEEFKLDVHGFAFVQHKSSEEKYDDKERITSVVYEEAAALLKKVYV
jgi:hypothetical protein